MPVELQYNLPPPLLLASRDAAHIDKEKNLYDFIIL